MSDYDLIIIGGGPAGYLSAERAGALGKRVLLVEEATIGGVCLNEGCIPTKTLLHGAKLYQHARDSAAFGVSTTGAAYDITAAMAHKAKTVTALQKGVMAQMKRHGVTVQTGHATLLGPGSVAVDGQELSAQNVLIATGGKAIRPPIPGAEDNPAVMTSREILSIDHIPSRLVVVGGGYIGMEFASYFAAVGSEVTVVEMTDEIIPMLQPSLAQALRKQVPGVTYRLGHRVTDIQTVGDQTMVSVVPTTGGNTDTIDTDLVLLSAGRAPNIGAAGLIEAGIDCDRLGVKVDEYMQTNLPGVYAAGDVTGRMLLAHAAYRMGEVAVSHMFRPQQTTAAGRTRWPNRMRYHAVPWVVFTSPEVAGCGLNPSEAADHGYDAVSATLPLQVSGRYLAEHPRERGTVTVVADRASGKLLGAQLMGTGVGEIIHSVAIMIEQELRVQDLREIVFPHPTVSEALRDAAWSISL
mgnify:CR=1 FL=1